MNKEELENAFNETTDNAVKVINDYKELIVKYNIMKENTETLAKRIDKAIEYINQLQFAFDFDKDIKKFAFDFLYTDEGKKLLNILKGEDKYE